MERFQFRRLSECLRFQIFYNIFFCLRLFSRRCRFFSGTSARQDIQNLLGSFILQILCIGNLENRILRKVLGPGLGSSFFHNTLYDIIDLPVPVSRGGHRCLDNIFCRLCSGSHCLRRHSRGISLLKAMVVFILLDGRQRRKLHFQFHSLCYIFPFAEPQDQVVALFYAGFFLSCFCVKSCQFVRPSLCILSALIFLKD